MLSSHQLFVFGYLCSPKMSGGLTCRVHCGVRMFFSVQQCVRNSFIKKRKFIYYLNFSTKLPRTVPLVEIKQNITRGSQFVRDCHLRWYDSNLIKYGNNVWVRYCPFGTQPTDTDSSQKEKIDDKKLGIFQKIKKMWKEYWYVVFPVHVVTSLGWFGGFYYLVCSGIDVPALLSSLGAPESWIEKLMESNAGNIVLTYTLYKIATPVRYTVTVGGTTLSINFLRKMGWMPPPLKNTLSKFQKDRCVSVKDTNAHTQDKMQVTRDEFLMSKKKLVVEQLREIEGEFLTSASERRTVENPKSNNGSLQVPAKVLNEKPEWKSKSKVR